MKTYTFWLRYRDGRPTGFLPILRVSDVEAMSAAREMALADSAIEEIEVCFGDAHLFAVRGATAPAGRPGSPSR
jgi:hypothetical protein